MRQESTDISIGTKKITSHQKNTNSGVSFHAMGPIRPNPIPPLKRPYQFRVVKEFNDLNRLQNDKDDKSVITLEHRYISPTPAIYTDDTPEDILTRLIMENGGPINCKVLYITRHGQSKHNADAMETGGDQYSAVCAHFSQDRDPALTNSGEQEAAMAGDLISTSEAVKYAVPSVVYCSTLKRTLQTAVICAARYLPTNMPLTLFPRDGLREFMGPGHLHVSDGRGNKSDILETLSELGEPKQLSVKLEDDLPDEDDGFRTAETYINVDIRIEKELANIFDDTTNRPSSAVHIVSHNRAIQSILRCLGYSTNQSNYRIFDFDNAATIALLVSRTPRTERQQEDLQASDEALQREESAQIDESYCADINSGFEKIQKDCMEGRSDKWQPWLKKLEEELANGPSGDVIEWRLELLKKAMSGEFKYGEFAMQKAV